MPIDHKPITAIDEDDLLSLVEDGVQEGLSIEYKRSLPGKTDDDKRKFLRNVSSFANSAGGHLLFGVEEAPGSEGRGMPGRLCGIGEPDVDGAMQRLNSLMQDGIRPRISGIQMQPVRLRDGAVVLVMRIPRSWAGPHMVCYQTSSGFYARNAAGSYPLDVDQLRSAFAGSQATSERIRQFRLERLSTIDAGEAPVRLPDGPKLVLHMVPLLALEPGVQVDLGLVARSPGLAIPPAATGWDSRYTFDGMVSYDPADDAGLSSSYVQVFRNGMLEAVMAGVALADSEAKFLRPIGYEGSTVRALQCYFGLYASLQVAPPVVVMLSLLGGKGYTLYVDPRRYPSRPAAAISRDALLVPEVMVEDLQSNAGRALRPLLDALWNACGRPGSPNYDAEGNWAGDRQR